MKYLRALKVCTKLALLRLLNHPDAQYHAFAFALMSILAPGAGEFLRLPYTGVGVGNRGRLNYRRIYVQYPLPLLLLSDSWQIQNGWTPFVRVTWRPEHAPSGNHPT